MSDTAPLASWRAFIDPRGYFRFQMPDDWSVALNEHSFTFSKSGQVWPDASYLTALRPPDSPDEAGRHWGVTVRVDQYADTPSNISKGRLPSEPSDPGFIGRYRLAHPCDNVMIATGHMRVWVQYDVARVPSHYRSFADAVPPPLTADEQRDRLAVIQRIVASFELLADGT